MHPTNPTCPFCGVVIPPSPDGSGWGSHPSATGCHNDNYSHPLSDWARRPAGSTPASPTPGTDHSVTAAEIGFLLGRSYSGSDEPAAKQVAEKLGIKLKERS